MTVIPSGCSLNMSTFVTGDDVTNIHLIIILTDVSIDGA